MICHHYKCIFVHTPKTAGQSIEHIFVDLLNLNWETRAPLLLRYNDRPELGPPRLAHLKANQYVRYKYLTQEMFNDYFKFSFVRNPWDRMISIYKHKYMGFDKNYEFKSFLTYVYKAMIRKEQYELIGPQSEFVCGEDEKILMDYIGKFERLQSDFDSICQKIGFPPIKVPHVNKTTSTSPSYKRYQDYYDNESRELIAELYKKDIGLFEYKFDENPSGRGN